MNTESATVSSVALPFRPARDGDHRERAPDGLPSVPSLFQRIRASASALATLARDPGRLDQVLVFAQAINAGAIARNARRIETTAEGRALFAERPRIDREHVDFDALRRLPDGTLGREYARFLDDNGITPEPFEK